MLSPNHLDTICAQSTAPGIGGIALIRVSGTRAFELVELIFSKKLHDKKSHTAHFGLIKNGEQLIDEVLITVFKNPHSFTGEDTIEIACHGSVFIQQELLRLLLDKGCRMATAGEFTLRAFSNGKMDLTQAEAVADLIAADSAAAHQVAMHQLKGGFSKEIGRLREKLIDFASLIELELDFAEEDVEFADRSALLQLLNESIQLIKQLVASFATGNAIKNGLPVAIVGAPNAGKSTLLNSLLNEERAIVSEIAGTTRDSIEDQLNIEGINFRFIDTAGIRQTEDLIENLGINRTFEKAQQAQVILYLVDVNELNWKAQAQKGIAALRQKAGNKPIFLLANKTDQAPDFSGSALDDFEQGFAISAKNKLGIDALKQGLLKLVNTGILHSGETVVSNLRHYEALSLSLQSLTAVQNGLSQKITGDFLAMDIRQALHHLGTITGQISTEDLLGSIFSRFCIGK